MTDLQKMLFELADPGYKQFQAGLLPHIDPDTIIGVRTPELRKLARQMHPTDARRFFGETPHRYYDENLLHALLLSELNNFSLCATLVGGFLPYVDNWAVCDQLRPWVFKRNTERLLPYIESWILSGRTYHVRFGVEMLMLHYLVEHFDIRYLHIVAAIDHSDYYVKMAVAWYFATALAEQYEITLPFFEDGLLYAWQHNKAIQKAVESRRIPAERKDYLKTLKIKEVNENG